MKLPFKKELGKIFPIVLIGIILHYLLKELIGLIQ